MFTLINLGVYGATRLILTLMPGSYELRFALAGVVACIVYIVVNYAILAPLLVKRGISLRETFSFDNLSTDLVLAALGLIVAAFWIFDPYLVPFAILPLVLIHRALSVPQLQAEARVD